MVNVYPPLRQQETHMAAPDDKFMVEGVDLSRTRNRNEIRVVKAIRTVLGEPPVYTPDPKDIQDIYALALNALPPRYAQHGTIVLRDPVRDEQILEAVRDAFIRVMEHPKA
jgi:hypothetical protein